MKRDDSIRANVQKKMQGSNVVMEQKEVIDAATHIGNARASRLLLLQACQDLQDDIAKASGMYLTHMPVLDKGWTEKWLTQFELSHLASHQLPLMKSLPEFITSSLQTKIPIHQVMYDHWMEKMKPKSSELMDKMFVISNSEPCIEFVSRIESRVVLFDDISMKKYPVTSFWDGIIHYILNFSLRSFGYRERFSNNQTFIEPYCPNVIFQLDSICVFEGNEMEASRSIETELRILMEKKDCIHEGIPYLFGFLSTGFHAILYAVQKSRTSSSHRCNFQVLGEYNLESLEGRLNIMLAILNIARLLQSIVGLCPANFQNDFVTILRQSGTLIHLCPSHVVKIFPSCVFEDIRSRGVKAYSILKDHNIPNVDRLHSWNRGKCQMIFEPRGWCKKPSTMNELFRALHDICKALIKLHAASWMHRDIRWGNVIFKRSDDATNSWCLIDFMDAAESPQPKSNGQHLSCNNHAPEIFSQDTHTTAVDIWSMGYLITSSGYELSHIWKSGKDRTAFLNSIMHQTPAQRPSASKAFQHLQKLEQEYLQETVQAQEGDYINVG